MEKDKVQKIVITAIVIVAVIVISLTAYVANSSKKRNDFAEEITQYSEIQDDGASETASTQMGKSVEESSDVVENKNTKKDTTATKKSTSKENNEKDTTKNEVSTNSEVTDKKEDEEKNNGEVTFSSPVKGEVLREFAQDSLVYSDTLQEWITHNGVDIKADKTSVVTAASSGTVYAIKNDPRYGLTVIINHDDEYQTIYSNLLTAEFVVQGEEVEEGQSIGTVGNTASFETADEPHLHFELLKDNEYVDPTIYMEF